MRVVSTTPLKFVRQVETHRAWLDGMKVYVRYPVYRFAWQAGDIKVIDVVVFRIKQNQDINLRPERCSSTQ